MLPPTWPSPQCSFLPNRVDMRNRPARRRYKRLDWAELPRHWAALRVDRVRDMLGDAAGRSSRSCGPDPEASVCRLRSSVCRFAHFGTRSIPAPENAFLRSSFRVSEFVRNPLTPTFCSTARRHICTSVRVQLAGQYPLGVHVRMLGSRASRRSEPTPEVSPSCADC